MLHKQLQLTGTPGSWEGRASGLPSNYQSYQHYGVCTHAWGDVSRALTCNMPQVPVGYDTPTLADAEAAAITPVQVINKYQGINAIWMPDVVGRAYGNRGNARSRQVRLSRG